MMGDLLMAYYGDDFTGSTDVMEALSAGGVETVLFTRMPDAETLARFSHCRAVGLAGTARSRSPAWMDDELPAVFAWLGGLGARFCHYKVCSTFDSAPGRGSIGRAAEIGLRVFDQQSLHILVGAPQLKRYTFAGHLFAAYRDHVYRIDRHPVMSCHPATPMREADLLVHLSHQTDLPSALISNAGTGGREARLLLIDVYDVATQAQAGTVLEFAAETMGPFILGSSGVEYALLSHWVPAGIAGPAPDFTPLAGLDSIAVVSGSCSPTTARQIEMALAAGFVGIPINYEALAGGQGRDAALAAARGAAGTALRGGKSPLIHTALGPQQSVAAGGAMRDDLVGLGLGQVLEALRQEFALPRIVVAGGDTSSHALEALDVQALTLRLPLPESPGSPVCLAHPANPEAAPFELVLKGGQIGRDDYFLRMRDGFA